MNRLTHQSKTLCNEINKLPESEQKEVVNDLATELSDDIREYENWIFVTNWMINNEQAD